VASKLFDKVRRNIKRIRKERGWSQAELARRAGVASTDVNRVERGPNADMLLSRLELFARVLEVGVKELVE
jgi:transcriptional regulator with XRE-family HTH domain